MLFSRDDVASFINQNFEPVWESVRPVPIVTINFGNGTVVTRTLHGNIATYVCTSEGQVIDILPGIYEPATYLSNLDQLRSLADQVRTLGTSDREKCLAGYHRSWTVKLPNVSNSTPTSSRVDLPTGRIEGGTKDLVIHRENVEGQEQARSAPPRGVPENLGIRELLAEDTRLNETVRRQQIHSKLASGSLVRPEELLKWLYKDVLLTDLDDPYLGLRSSLFDSYPLEDGPVR